MGWRTETQAGLYYKEHAPPHFHAEYGDFEVTIEIESGIVSGRFPRRALNIVLECGVCCIKKNY